jgi:hypothetical protein
MQKRLVVCCVMENIQQEDDIETRRVQGQPFGPAATATTAQKKYPKILTL